jgi:hypothetical protein
MIQRLHHISAISSSYRFIAQLYHRSFHAKAQPKRAATLAALLIPPQPTGL